MYFQYDNGDDEFMSIGYNHPVKDFGSWSLAVGASYDFDSASEVKFMKIYMLDVYPINEKVSLFGTLGYGISVDDGMIEDLGGEIDGGLTYGLGFHYKLNDKMGMGLGFNYLDYTWEHALLGESEETAERTDLHFSYSF